MYTVFKNSVLYGFSHTDCPRDNFTFFESLKKVSP